MKLPDKFINWLTAIIAVVNIQFVNTTTDQLDVDFECPEKFGYFPDPYDCTKYFVCVFGDPLHESCTGGLFFSVDHQTCDWPRNTPCIRSSNAHVTSKNPNLVKPSDDLVPTSDLSNKNANNGVGVDSDTNADGILNLASSSSSRLLINQSSFDRIVSSTSTSSSSTSTSSLSTSSVRRLLQSQAQNSRPLINNNFRHSILTQTSTGPKYESSNSAFTSSKVFFDENIRKSEASHQLNNPDNNGHTNLSNDNSNSGKSTGSNSDIDVLQSTPEASVPLTRKHTHNTKHNDANDQPNSPLSSSSTSQVSSNSFIRSRPHPFVRPINSQSDSSDKPIVLVSVSTSDSDDQLNANARDFHISRSIPRRRPPKRLELPNVPNSSLQMQITSNSTSSGQKGESQSLPLAFFNPSEPNSTQRTIVSLPSLKNSNFARNNLGHFSSPANVKLKSTTTATTITTSTERPIPTSYLFPQDGQPFGLLDYETLLSDSDDFHGQTPPSSEQSNKRKSSINPSNNPPPSHYSSSFDSSSKINSGESVSPRITELPSENSRIQIFSSVGNPSTTVEKCNSSNCKLPNCNCGSSKIPNSMKLRDVPQIILLTFDDAVNDLNWDIYEQIFNSGRKNPNGCPILGTFYVSHEWTDYSQVQTLYSRGHEIASHGISHSFGEKFTKSQWFKEIDGQRKILNLYAGVKLEDVRGMRAPFLQIGGNKQFEMLHEANFTYDSSMPIFENDPPFYPYTLDHSISHECMITPCPSKSFAGLWEVGLVMYQDLQGGRCSMADACQNPPDADSVFKMLLKNFNRHYKSNRAPFGLFYHSAWFNTQHHFKGFLKFIDHVLTKSDVYFTTNWQMIQWMKNPTSIANLKSFNAWNCYNNQRPIGECLNPHVCTVKHKEGSRFMKTCQTCPIYYPWVGRIA